MKQTMSKSKEEKREEKVYIGTSWFMLSAPKGVRHECRLQYLLECHIFINSNTLTTMNSSGGG